MSKCCRKAYDQALGPHHPWAVRMAAKIGIKTVPNRDEYMNRLLGQAPLETQLDLFRRMMELSAPLREVLWQFYNEHNLTGLP